MTTLPEMFALVKYLEAATQTRRVTVLTARIYFDMLRDLPFPILVQAAKQALLSHQYATLPSIAVIRREAMTLMRQEPTPLEAWQVVCQVAARFGLHRSAEAQSWLARHVSPVVAEAARSFGWRRICDSTPGEAGTVCAQWRDHFSAIVERQRRRQVLPQHVRASARELHASWTPRLLESSWPDR